MRKQQGQKAWLLYWEWGGAHAAVEDRVAAILRPRLSQRIVGEIVQALYAIHAYSPTELALFSKQPNMNPYKVQWQHGHCSCGGNPTLHATYVHDLVIDTDASTGLETIRWVLPPIHRFHGDSGNRELIRAELPQQTARAITGALSDREIGRHKPEWARPNDGKRQ